MELINIYVLLQKLKVYYYNHNLGNVAIMINAINQLLECYI